MHRNRDRLIILDADGTIIDAFRAIDQTFSAHGMQLGDLERFQKRHNLFKYLGGLKEFPFNLKHQLGKQSRRRLLATLTDVYREEASLFPGMVELVQRLVAEPGIRVGIVTRNVTNDPETTIRVLLKRNGVDVDALDFMIHVPLGSEKTAAFRAVRQRFGINPARSFACGDEHKDFACATATGMHPFIVSYGFEDYLRLTKKFDVPQEVISRTPQELSERVLHALDIGAPTLNES